jgi:two-component system chemotaxis response regulator CheY
MNALIVDDSSAMRLILRKMLSEMGVAASEAANGAEAYRQLQEGSRPDFILVDWAMPEMNGLDFLLKVREEPSYAGLRIVMVTSESQPESVMRALSAGADEYVMKPFTKEVLRDKLALLGLAEA